MTMKRLHVPKHVIMMSKVWLFLSIPYLAHGHYCSDASNGVVAPTVSANITSLCSYKEGTPIRVTIGADSQPDSLYKFGGPGQAGKTYVFSTCGFTDEDLDTGLSVWNAAGDTLIDCDDDSCELQRKASSLVFALPNEEMYLLRPWIFDGSPGVFEFGYFSGAACSLENTNFTLPDPCLGDLDENDCRLYCDTWKCQLKPVEYQDLCESTQLQYVSNTAKLLPCQCASLKLALQTDAWSNETSVVLKSLDNATVIWDFPQGSFTKAFHSYVSEEKCLDPAVCYQLTITDLWADGICCYSGLGSYEISYDGQVVASGGDFTESATHLIGNCA